MSKQTKAVKVGPVTIGAGNPIAVQSMTSTPTTDIKATLTQIEQLASAGCEIIRVSVPDDESVKSFKSLQEKTKIPLVSDIHFHWHLAISAIKAGAYKIRINPGNIGSLQEFGNIIDTAKSMSCSMRIGVNAGSLNRKYHDLYKKSPVKALVNSLTDYLDYAVSRGFEDIVTSVKSSSVAETITANRLLASKTDFPIHLGITEAGTYITGSIKSAVGLGILLNEGIGDTVRVSLTDDPIKEVEVAYKILGALDIRKRGVDLISCPTCARCEVDIINLARQAEKRLENVQKPIKVAIMGCVVNGPGEAKDADIGIAAGRKSGLLFVKGKVIAKYPEEKLLEALIKKLEEQFK